MEPELWKRDAVDLVAAIANGELTSTEVVTSVVDRMRAENKHLNAVVRDLGDEAIEAAQAADQAAHTARSSGEPLGALHGIPVTIKINADVMGQATDNGIPALADLIAPGDSPVAANFKKAGAILIGRTNAPEFSMRATTENPLHGRTFNPWDPATSPGGSSGGAGSAAAAGFGPIHHGNDIGGSLRLPAFANGVVTLKPTQGRMPSFSTTATGERGLLSQLMSTQGVIARSVADVRLGTQVLAERDPRDPFWVPAPWDGPTLAKKVAVTTDGYGYSVNPEILAAVDKAASALSDAGYQVEEVKTPSAMEALQGWMTAGVTELKLTLGAAADNFGSEDLKFVFDQFYAYGKIVDLVGYQTGLSDRTRQIRNWQLFLEDYPIVLTPLLLRPMFVHNYDLQGTEATVDLMNSMVYCTGLNFVGLPSGVVPVGFAGGVPAGVQLIGGRFREDVVLEAMAAVEAKVGRIVPQLWDRPDPR